MGEIEDWVIINSGMVDHPFHIHVNPFQVIDENGQPEAIWRDILVVKPGIRKRIRIKFEDFTGKAVYHCHILDHEDLGMRFRHDGNCRVCRQPRLSNSGTGVSGPDFTAFLTQSYRNNSQIRC